MFKEHKCKNTGLQEKNLLSLSYGKIIRKNINTNEGLLPESFETYNIIEKGCIVFRLTDLQNDKHSLRTGLCKERGIITSAYLTIETTENDNAEFMHYLFHVYDVCKVFYNMGDGVRQSIKFNEMKNLSVILPPLEEQKKISAYLDKKCAAIDSAVDAAKKLVVKFGEYKKALITETVTKGLNTAAKMQDSGVEWLGDIPAHWKISNVGKHFEIVLGKMLQPYKINENDTLENYLCAVNLGKNQLNINEVRKMWFSESEKKIYRLQKNDLLVVEGGDIASAAILDFEVENLYFQNALHRVRAKEKCSIPFLKYWIHFVKSTGYIDLICNKATIAHFTKKKFLKLPIPLLPLEEQKEIAAFLDSKCAAIDENIAKHQQLAEKLTEYKKSLIYEVVTGKMEV